MQNSFRPECFPLRKMLQNGTLVFLISEIDRSLTHTRTKKKLKRKKNETIFYLFFNEKGTHAYMRQPIDYTECVKDLD